MRALVTRNVELDIGGGNVTWGRSRSRVSDVHEALLVCPETGAGLLVTTQMCGLPVHGFLVRPMSAEEVQQYES